MITAREDSDRETERFYTDRQTDRRYEGRPTDWEKMAGKEIDTGK